MAANDERRGTSTSAGRRMVKAGSVVFGYPLHSGILINLQVKMGFSVSVH